MQTLNPAQSIFDVSFGWATSHVPGIRLQIQTWIQGDVNNIWQLVIYLRDWQNNQNDCIHRADLTGGNAVMKWSVANKPAGLSVNRADNVVVVCPLMKNTRHMVLWWGVTSRHHGLTVQLSSGDYWICQNAWYRLLIFLEIIMATVWHGKNIMSACQ